MLKNAEDRLVTNEEMFNVGQANAVQVRQARVRLQQAKLDAQMAANDRDQARRELAALAGCDLPPGNPADPFDDSVPPLTWEAALAYTVAESPEVREAGAKLRADQITVGARAPRADPEYLRPGGAGLRPFPAKQTVANAQVTIAVPLLEPQPGNDPTGPGRFAAATGRNPPRRVETRPRLWRSTSSSTSRHYSTSTTTAARSSPRRKRRIKRGSTPTSSGARRGPWFSTRSRELYMRQMEICAKPRDVARDAHAHRRASC